MFLAIEGTSAKLNYTYDLIAVAGAVLSPALPEGLVLIESSLVVFLPPTSRALQPSTTIRSRAALPARVQRSNSVTASPVTPSPRHLVTPSPRHPVTHHPSPHHPVTPSPRHLVTRHPSPRHPVTLSPHHPSPRHPSPRHPSPRHRITSSPVTQSPVTPSPRHPVTRHPSPRHPVIPSPRHPSPRHPSPRHPVTRHPSTVNRHPSSVTPSPVIPSPRHPSSRHPVTASPPHPASVDQPCDFTRKRGRRPLYLTWCPVAWCPVAGPVAQSVERWSPYGGSICLGFKSPGFEARRAPDVYRASWRVWLRLVEGRSQSKSAIGTGRARLCAYVS